MHLSLTFNTPLCRLGNQGTVPQLFLAGYRVSLVNRLVRWHCRQALQFLSASLLLTILSCFPLLVVLLLAMATDNFSVPAVASFFALLRDHHAAFTRGFTGITFI
jgi:hypothetical protein